MMGPLDFNPHEIPPQELKDIFKSWKGQLSPERERNLNESVVNMLRLESIPHHRLFEMFNHFSDDAKDPDIAEQVALNSSGLVYSSHSVSGMIGAFINIFAKDENAVDLFLLISDLAQVF